MAGLRGGLLRRLLVHLRVSVVEQSSRAVPARRLDREGVASRPGLAVVRNVDTVGPYNAVDSCLPKERRVVTGANEAVNG